MNQQNQGSGSSSSALMKRKRGRPRKEDSVAHGENMPGNVLNSNQTAGTTDDCDDEMVGKTITGVIEGTFNAGYLLNVKVSDSDACLRGLVFLPGQVAPVTAENDVAPHVKMIQRKEIPIPVMTPQPQSKIHGSSVECSKQPYQPELHATPSGISVSLENQSASTVLPVADLRKNQSCIPSEGTSEPGHESQSKLECVVREETLHEVDASMREKESRVDGGATEDTESASVLTSENTKKDEPNASDFQFNQIPVTGAMSSEQINFVEKPKTKLATETWSKVDTSNSNGRPSCDAGNGNGNIVCVGPNQALDTTQPESAPFVPSESKFLYEGCNSQETGDPQNCSLFGAVNKVDVTESIVNNSMESEKQIRSDIS